MPQEQVQAELATSQVPTLIEYKSGPDTNGPARCLKCLEPFKDGESWQKVWDPEHQYAIGIHSACLG
jgi:hypothetical protein